MAGEGKVEMEIIYCVPWQYHATAAWMANEFFAEGGKDVAIKITPGVSGILQVFLDGEKIFDRADEDGKYPDLTLVKQMRAVLNEKLSSLVTADDN